jgi:hypothetical protein
VFYTTAHGKYSKSLFYVASRSLDDDPVFTQDSLVQALLTSLVVGLFALAVIVLMALGSRSGSKPSRRPSSARSARSARCSG